MVNAPPDPRVQDEPKPPFAEAGEKAFSKEDVDAIVKKYDAESNFRNLKGITAKVTVVLCVMLSLFHVYTAGFGLLNEVMHRTVHLSFVLGLVFLVFPRRQPTRMGIAWGFGICFALFYLFLAWQLTDRFKDGSAGVGSAGAVHHGAVSRHHRPAGGLSQRQGGPALLCGLAPGHRRFVEYPCT